MKRIISYLAMAMALTACSSDDETLNEAQCGDIHPLLFTATVEDIQTRVTADNKWEDGNVIGVKISTDPSNIGKYTLNADGTVKEVIQGVNWQGTGTATITAWYPFDKQQNMNITDQSAGLKGTDLLKAELKNQTYEEGKTLQLVFKHQMARVRCRLKAANGSGMTDAELAENAKVEFVGETYLTFENGEVKNETSSYFITPYKTTENGVTTYTALLVPRTDKGGNALIKITVGNKVFNYKPADDINLEAGKSYNYQIKVNVPDYTTTNGTYHVYTAKGLKEWAKAVENSDDNNVSCKLENDIEMPALADGETSNWKPVDSFYGIFDGNGHTIKGLVVNNEKEGSNTGFIAINYGTVKNLTLENAKVTGGNDVGAVAGWNNYNRGTIENCHVTGASRIKGADDTGGVAGLNHGTILACHVAKDCDVISSGSYCGGIAGSISYDSSEITGCYALCSVTGWSHAGGITGYYDNGYIISCYSKCIYGTATGSGTDYYVGGIAGGATGTTLKIRHCYWSGDTDCKKGVGNATDAPNGVFEINNWGGPSDPIITNAINDMNNGLLSSAYEFFANTDGLTYADEPIKLVKNQQQRPAATR